MGNLYLQLWGSGVRLLLQAQPTPRAGSGQLSHCKRGHCIIFFKVVPPLGVPGTFLYFGPPTKTFEIGIALLSGVFDSFFLKAHPLLGEQGEGKHVLKGEFSE